MLYVLSFLLMILTSNAASKIDQWSYIDTKTRTALIYIGNDDFKSAYREINKLEEKYNKSKLEFPIHECLRAALYYKMIEEYRTKEFEKEFEKSVKKAIKILKNEDKDAEKGDKYKAKRLQLLSSVYGYRGMYRSLSGLWGSTFVDGRKACNILEDSLELDKSLIDNHAGIGTYLYWRSAKAGFIKYLLFWGNKKDEGIKEIKDYLKDYKVMKHWSLGGLLRIYIEEENWEEALKYADIILQETRVDSGTTRRKAFLLEKLERKEEALKLYKKLLSICKSKLLEFNTSNAQIEAIYHILRLSKELGLKVDKAKYLLEVEKLKITESFYDIDDYVNDIKEL